MSVKPRPAPAALSAPPVRRRLSPRSRTTHDGPTPGRAAIGQAEAGTGRQGPSPRGDGRRRPPAAGGAFTSTPTASIPAPSSRPPRRARASCPSSSTGLRPRSPSVPRSMARVRVAAAPPGARRAAASQWAAKCELTAPFSSNCPTDCGVCAHPWVFGVLRGQHANLSFSAQLFLHTFIICIIGAENSDMLLTTGTQSANRFADSKCKQITHVP